MGRRNKRRWNILFEVLNQRLMGLNMLWGGWNWAMKKVIWCHWGCAGCNFQNMCKVILKWPNKLLTVPLSMSSFREIAGKSKPYDEYDPGLVNVHEVDVNAVALPIDPPDIIPLLSILPEDVRCKYEKEEQIVSSNEADWYNMRECRPWLGMRVQEYIKIIQRLVKLGMVTLLPVNEVRVINGLHCVPKGDGRHRLIFDGRSVNCVLQEPQKMTLPDFSLLVDWEVSSMEAIRFGKMDLDNFYHRLGVPMWLVPFLGLPPVSAKYFGLKVGLVAPACYTLPMGLSHSVLLAQLAHLFILRNTSIASIVNRPIRRDASAWALLYIDDVLIGEKREKIVDAEEVVNKVIQECLQCYKEVGLVVNHSKLVWATPETIGLGCLLSEAQGGIIPKNEKLERLVAATKFLVQCEKVTRKNVEFLLGHWIWFILLYRPLYAIFFHIYRWMHTADDNSYRKLWVSVKRELMLAILFAERCKLSWARKVAPVVLAMDASKKGAGACEMEGQDHTIIELVGEGVKLKEAGPWKGVLNHQWHKEEHINVLEMRAVILSLFPRVQNMLHYGTKWDVVSDSWVVVGAVRKGRSSSYMLCCLLRRLITICMVMDAALNIEWIASENNPADLWSRFFFPDWTTRS